MISRASARLATVTAANLVSRGGRRGGEPLIVEFFRVALPLFFVLSARSVIDADIVDHREAEACAIGAKGEIQIV